MSTERILVVDDSPTQVEAARGLLEHYGYEVSIARTGEEALDLVSRERFDLVLSDVVMPGMSGYELCRKIKDTVAEPPAVVLLTSLNDPRDIVRGVEAGADNYITKPYKPEQLIERIRHVIENHRLRMSAPAGAPPTVRFLGETYTITSDAPQILALLLSSFEELIRTNAELQQSKRKAEAAIKVRDDVLATVSHDLKNPLGTIFTSASLLREVQLDEKAQHRQLEIISRTADRMNNLIKDLLEVSRMEGGSTIPIEPKPESVAALVREAHELHTTVADASRIDLVVELPDDDARVRADRDRVLQVFSNLIGNALKFTPAGGRITLSAGYDNGVARFSISDTGTGIPRNDLPRIFDRFWHGGAGAGSGLGLAIAKGIVEAHGGRISAESSGNGSTFNFTLALINGPSSAPDSH